MSIETLERPASQSPYSKQELLIASTLAVATLTGTFSTDVPTYITNSPSALISNFFTAENANVEIQKLIYSIRNYRTFEDNWDGYNGKPPTSAAIDDSINFIKQLPNNIAPPYAGLSGDGEINLFWDNNELFIDIGFTGNAKYSYYAKDSHGNEYSGNYVLIKDELPADLNLLLSTIKS